MVKYKIFSHAGKKYSVRYIFHQHQVYFKSFNEDNTPTGYEYRLSVETIQDLITAGIDGIKIILDAAEEDIKIDRLGNLASAIAELNKPMPGEFAT